MTIEDMIWEQASEHLYVSRETYMATLATWEIEPVERDGLLLGAVMRKGAEFHFVTFKAAARISRGIIRDALAPQLERYGHVLTRTPKLEARQHRFNRTIGFVAVGEDEFNVLYRLDRGRSAASRSVPCPQ